MRKILTPFLVIWAAMLAVFNVVTFVIPKDEYTVVFWIGYAMVTLAFLVHAGCAFLAARKNDANVGFLKLGVFKASFVSLIISFVVGTLIMAVDFLPEWIAIIICTVTCAYNLINVTRAEGAAMAVATVEKKVQQSTSSIRSIIALAETLQNHAKTDEARAAAKKVYEEIRYSDPVSSPALEGLEKQIQAKISNLGAALDAGSPDVVAMADEIILMIGDRNAMCKSMK